MFKSVILQLEHLVWDFCGKIMTTLNISRLKLCINNCGCLQQINIVCDRTWFAGYLHDILCMIVKSSLPEISKSVCHH